MHEVIFFVRRLFECDSDNYLLSEALPELLMRRQRIDVIFAEGKRHCDESPVLVRDLIMAAGNKKSKTVQGKEG
jgi:hypothetical protein